MKTHYEDVYNCAKNIFEVITNRMYLPLYKEADLKLKKYLNTVFDINVEDPDKIIKYYSISLTDDNYVIGILADDLFGKEFEIGQFGDQLAILLDLNYISKLSDDIDIWNCVFNISKALSEQFHLGLSDVNLARHNIILYIITHYIMEKMGIKYYPENAKKLCDAIDKIGLEFKDLLDIGFPEGYYRIYHNII